jgi:hypothetical protein
MVTRPSETSQTGAASDAPELAAAPPSRRRRRRGRGLLRALAVLVVVLGLAAAAATAWLVIGYLAFDEVADEAHARLGTAAEADLALAGAILDEPQLTLVYVTDPGGQGLGFTMLRTDPDARTTATLSFSSAFPVSVDGGPPIELRQAPREGGPAAVLRALRPVLGRAPNHVIAISLRGLRRLVDRLGGVMVNSPAPFESVIGDRAFPAGRLEIGGDDLEAYSSGSDFASASANQRRLMRAIVAELADVGTLTDLPSLARAVGRPLTTDLGTRELLELGYVQARANSGSECGAARGSSAAIVSFMSLDAVGFGCRPATMPNVGRVPSPREIVVAGVSLAVLLAATVALLVVKVGHVVTARRRGVDRRRARPAWPLSSGRNLRSRARATRRPRAGTRAGLGSAVVDGVADALRRPRARRGGRRAHRHAGRRRVAGVPVRTLGDRIADVGDWVSTVTRELGTGVASLARRAGNGIADSVLDTWDAIAERWDSRRRRR